MSGFTPLIAQKSNNNEEFLPVEQELAGLATVILQGDPLPVKIAANRQFTSLLIETLKQPASYDYSWDSLKTISVLRPADNSFRLFTWHIVDESAGGQYHYYFGLVQRRYTDADGAEQFAVIPLLEMSQVPQGVENMLLESNNWFGAQYYLGKYDRVIPAYHIRYHDRPRSSQEKPKTVDNTFYLLMGWNGNDETSNFKVLDVISFDPENPTRVLFGADVFYFDVVPKSRAIFRYSDNAPFTMNMAYVKYGAGKKLMVVYDHLANPNKLIGQNEMRDSWDMGPDGSYDALVFEHKRKKMHSKNMGNVNARDTKGYFDWHRNVALAESYNERMNQKRIEERRYESLKAQFGEAEARRAAHGMARAERNSDRTLQKKLAAQREEEARRLKAAGIDTHKKKN